MERLIHPVPMAPIAMSESLGPVHSSLLHSALDLTSYFLNTLNDSIDQAHDWIKLILKEWL